MAALGTGNLTLLDWAKRLDPDGKVPMIAELLSQKNAIIETMVAREANDGTGHRITQRTALPTVSARSFNEGVSASKSTTAQVVETIAMYEAKSEVDVALARLNGNSAAFRLSEAKAFIEAMNIQVAGDLFTASKAVSPSKFNGFRTRYASTSGDTGDNIVAMNTQSGADCLDCWLVVWGDETCYTIFPKGSKAGLGHYPLQDDYVQDAASKEFFAHRDRWTWDIGLAVHDWRGVVRGSIDKDVLSKTGSLVIDGMITMTHRTPCLTMGRPVFYVGRVLMQYLHHQARAGASYMLTVDTVEGKPKTTFLGIPVVLNDALTTCNSVT